MALSRRAEWRVELNVEVSLLLQLLFVSQTQKNVFVGTFRDAARCKWGKVAIGECVFDGGANCIHECHQGL